jgi:ATP-dependent Clp protease adapter protein ClpS
MATNMYTTEADNPLFSACKGTLSIASAADSVVLKAASLPGIEENPLASLNEYFKSTDDGYMVVVYDNDTNTYDQVIGILMNATGCTLEEAHLETWEIHHLGKSVVHHGTFAECNRAAGIIRQIGIRVEVLQV